MEDFIIVVNRVEELQLTNDRHELQLILTKAKRAITGGQDVILVRETKGKQERFDTISNESDLEDYKKRVLRFL